VNSEPRAKSSGCYVSMQQNVHSKHDTNVLPTAC